MSNVQTQNKLGQWIPAIPLPFYYLIRKGCSCGRKFWTEEGYEAHYALKHIIYPEPTKEELLELEKGGMKTVCGECGGDLKEVQSFKAKVSSWYETLSAWITIYQCKKCKAIFTKQE